MTTPTEAPWGPGKPPFIIAEIGLTHEGSLGNALAFIDACADVGASAVKFQCHDGDGNCEFRKDFAWPQDYDRQFYWDRTRFTRNDWCALRHRADDREVLFGCTPFSLGALWLVQGYCRFLKISRQHAFGEVHSAAYRIPLPLLHTGQDGLGLNHYVPDKHIGISDHSGHTCPSLDAIKNGAQVAELHVCWDRRQFGPDVQYSVTIDELGELVRAVR